MSMEAADEIVSWKRKKAAQSLRTQLSIEPDLTVKEALQSALIDLNVHEGR